eukprot:TRINITY_DN9847_c0_g1_i1.p1 TRINITY_DN9847_c0_g1~~TRINITY_DN9847_c0_g1_i1.p1  ORF type:complete len:147 (-),score=29.50 TRINITY_DN9847_c0_g1_i1:27-467(-)
MRRYKPNKQYRFNRVDLGLFILYFNTLAVTVWMVSMWYQKRLGNFSKPATQATFFGDGRMIVLTPKEKVEQKKEEALLKQEKLQQKSGVMEKMDKETKKQEILRQKVREMENRIRQEEAQKAEMKSRPWWGGLRNIVGNREKDKPK